MADFKVGDVVVLKSGGPLMTVASTTAGSAKDQIFVMWFCNSSSEQAKTGVFIPQVLKKVDDR